jgi:hypothetical protein
MTAVREGLLKSGSTYRAVCEEYCSLDPTWRKGYSFEVKADGRARFGHHEISVDHVSDLRWETEEREGAVTLDFTGGLPSFAAKISADWSGGVFPGLGDRLLIGEIQGIVVLPHCATRVGLCFDHIGVPRPLALATHGDLTDKVCEVGVDLRGRTAESRTPYEGLIVLLLLLWDGSLARRHARVVALNLQAGAEGTKSGTCAFGGVKW